MSEYLGKSFDRAVNQIGCVIVLLLIAAVVTAFFLGRCSAKYEVRTPVVEKSKV